MKVRDKNEYDVFQLTKDNYNEFKKYISEEKGWSLSPLYKGMNKYFCYTTDTLEPVYINEGDYVVFHEHSIVEILNEKKFFEKYETI